MNERHAWRRYFEVLATDERGGIETAPEERVALLRMCRQRNVFWRNYPSPSSTALSQQ
jgi:hypothetical protein